MSNGRRAIGGGDGWWWTVICSAYGGSSWRGGLRLSRGVRATGAEAPTTGVDGLCTEGLRTRERGRQCPLTV